MYYTVRVSVAEDQIEGVEDDEFRSNLLDSLPQALGVFILLEIESVVVEHSEGYVIWKVQAYYDRALTG